MTSTLVDRLAGVAEGLAVKAAVRAATTANITLAGEQTIDTVALVEGDRVLVKDQTDATLNGIYGVSTGNWARTDDFDGARDVIKGTRVYVNEGAINGDGEFTVTTADPIVPGSTSIGFQSMAVSTAAAQTLASQYATKIDDYVTGTTDNSAKSWATGGTGSGQPAAGDAKSWASKTSGDVDGASFSAKEYAQGSQALTGGSAANWAQQAGAEVTGAAAGSVSAKEWAVGSFKRGVAGFGSAKDWANYIGGTVDNAEYSAKKYATDASGSATAAAASNTAAANWAVQAANAAASVVGEGLFLSVNSFYPTSTITGQPIPVSVDSSSRPLSSFFNTLAEAQAAFPYCSFDKWGITLASQVDDCAWQSAADYVYASTVRTMSSLSGYISGTTLTLTSGSVAVNRVLTGPGVFPGTTVISGAGSTWTVDIPQTVGSAGSPVAMTSTASQASGTIRASGRYAVSRPIVFRGSLVSVRGSGQPFNFTPLQGATAVVYIGAARTQATQGGIFTFDCQTCQGKAGGLRVYDLGFSVSLNGVAPAGGLTDIANATWVNGVQLGAVASASGTFNNLCEVARVTFTGGVWDGIRTMVPQIDAYFHDCFFYGVQRDCLAAPRAGNADHTTIRAERNYYGFYGRYAELLSGGVASRHISFGSIVEGNTTTSYFQNNPQWYMQGLAANCCYIGCGVSTVENVYFEGGANYTRALWADIHICGGAGLTLDRASTTNLAISAKSAATNALGTFYSTYKFDDITDQCNYNVETGAGTVSELTVINPYDFNLGLLLLIGQVGALTGTNHFRAVNHTQVIVPTQNYTLADASTFVACALRDTAVVTLTDAAASKINYEMCRVTRKAGSYFKYRATVFSGVSMSGAVQVQDSHTEFSQWAPNTLYRSATLTPSFSNSNPFISPITENGRVYQCTTGGTSGASEPSWPTTIGATVADGTAVWTCVGFAYVVADVGAGGRDENWARAVREFWQAAAPTAGVAYTVGSKCWFDSFADGAAPGAMYTAGGHWKNMPAVAA